MAQITRKITIHECVYGFMHILFVITYVSLGFYGKNVSFAFFFFFGIDIVVDRSAVKFTLRVVDTVKLIKTFSPLGSELN